MPRAQAGRKRTRGSVDRLPSGAYRVRVYGGVDAVSGRRHDLVEIIPPGPRAQAQAEAARTRMLNEVDERRNPRTSATVNQLLDRYLEMIDVSASTHLIHARYLQKHVRPFIGDLKAGAVDPDVLETADQSAPNGRRLRAAVAKRAGPPRARGAAARHPVVRVGLPAGGAAVVPDAVAWSTMTMPRVGCADAYTRSASVMTRCGSARCSRSCSGRVRGKVP